MLSLKKAPLTAIASFLASAIFAGIFADLLLPMLGLTGVSFDMYRIQICLVFLCSVAGICTYITIRKIYELSLDFSRRKNEGKIPF